MAERDPHYVKRVVLPSGKTIVITVTGHGLKDTQWAIKGAEAEDASAVEPKRVPFDVVPVAAALGLE